MVNLDSNVHYLTPTADGRHRVNIQWPEKGDGCACEKVIGQQMGNNDGETQEEADPWQSRPHSPCIGAGKSCKQRKEDTVGGAAVKRPALVSKDEPEDHIDIGKIGEDSHQQCRPPIPEHGLPVGRT